MAIGTITRPDKAGFEPSAPIFIDRLSFTGDALYPTGGTAFLALFRALTKDSRTPVAVIAQDCGGYQVLYDHTAGKLKVFQGDNANGSAAPGVEVTNNTNLGATTFNVTVISQ